MIFSVRFCFLYIIDWYAMWHNLTRIYTGNLLENMYFFFGENIGFGWMNKNNEIKSIEQKKNRELHHLILMILNGKNSITKGFAHYKISHFTEEIYGNLSSIFLIQCIEIGIFIPQCFYSSSSSYSSQISLISLHVQFMSVLPWVSVSCVHNIKEWENDQQKL